MVEAMEIPKGFKKTEIGIIPDDWDVYELGIVASYRRGSFPQPYGLPQWYDENNGMPFVQVFDVDDNMKLKPETKQKISDAAKDKSVFVPKGTIVLTIQGSIGRIAVTQYDAYVDRTLLIFQSFRKPIDKWFFMYVVYQLFQIEKAKAPGGTIKTITKAELSNFLIPLPPTKAEQTAIAEALNDADALITELEKLIAKKKAIKQGAMQELLKPKEGWEVKCLSELGFMKSSSVDKIIRENEKVVSLLNYMDVYRHTTINQDKIFALTSANSTQINSLNLLNGDIVFTPTSETPDDIGHAALMQSDLENTVFSYHLTRLRFTGNDIINEIKPFIFNSKALRDYFTLRATGSTRFVLKKGDFENAPLSYPKDKSDQTRIAQILCDMDAEIAALEKKLDKYKMLKQGMMQNLLTGKIRLV